MNRILTAALFLLIFASPVQSQTPFELNIPGYDSDRFRITEFATGLNYPVGMVELPDGSVAVLTSNGPSFFGSRSGSIIRLTDADNDGVSNDRTVLSDSVPGGKMSALRMDGDLLVATGQGTAISFFDLDDELRTATQVGQIDVNYPPGGWLHPHSALAVSHTESSDRNYSVYFQLGSDTNFNKTERTVSINADFGLQQELAGDALHRLTFHYNEGEGIQDAAVQQVATGLRNAAGMAFHPLTGNLYVQDNGIDGVRNANEPTSADEINLLPVDSGGDQIVDYGFPDSYVEYRTGNLIGDPSLAPLVAFLPVPNPADGAEAEGPNDVSFGPTDFPLPLRYGLFVGMHGKFSLGGRENEENPLVYVDLRDNSFQHVISSNEPNVGHLDGILATNDALYLADISPGGAFNSDARNTGIIYRIESLYPTIDEITVAVNGGVIDPVFDLNSDNIVDTSDRTMLIKQINDTFFGDSTLDRKFNSSDLVRVFQIGAYENTNFPNEVTWESGDWNGDGKVGSSDLVLAFTEGVYEADMPIRQIVPEPSSGIVAFLGCLVCYSNGRARKSLCTNQSTQAFSRI